MLRGDGWSFIHIPKCGGTSVRSVLKGREVSEVLPMFPDSTITHKYHWVAKKQLPGRVFCFVRHPLSWLESYWAMRMLEAPNDANVLDHYLDKNFDVFARRVCRSRPGYVGQMFDAYTEHATEVHRLEDGVDSVLTSVTGRIIRSRRKNRGHLPEPNHGTVKMVEAAERQAIIKYGYSS